MVKDPWTDPNPQPGDFDDDLSEIDPRYIEAHEGNPAAKLTIVIGIEDEDAGAPSAARDRSGPTSSRRHHLAAA